MPVLADPSGMRTTSLGLYFTLGHDMPVQQGTVFLTAASAAELLLVDHDQLVTAESSCASVSHRVICVQNPPPPPPRAAPDVRESLFLAWMWHGATWSGSSRLERRHASRTWVVRPHGPSTQVDSTRQSPSLKDLPRRVRQAGRGVVGRAHYCNQTRCHIFGTERAQNKCRGRGPCPRELERDV